MIIAALGAADSLASQIPSFSDRLNFSLPLIAVLLVVSFFLLLKSYTVERGGKEDVPGRGGKDQPG